LRPEIVGVSAGAGGGTGSQPLVDAARVDEILVHKTATYRTGLFVVTVYTALAHRLRVEHAHLLPREGGVVVVANHQSFLDIPIVAAAARRHVAFVGRDTLTRSRFLAFVMRNSGSILVRRGQADRAALRAMVTHLERGDCVCLFPEGTRSPDGS